MKEGIACNYPPVSDWIIPVLAECELSSDLNKKTVSHTKEFLKLAKNRGYTIKQLDRAGLNKENLKTDLLRARASPDD